VFVPSYRQCRLNVNNLITHCAADDDPEKFRYKELDQLQPHLDHITDKGMTEMLKHGIGYYHEVLSHRDKSIVQRLFESGAIQVLVASKVRDLNFYQSLGRTQTIDAGHRLESPRC
jgi:pre-mRNA-splicing helicase BRR2